MEPWNVFIFTQIMTSTVKSPNIKACCLVPNRLTDLQELSEGLESCQKSLNDYLNAKRNAFPRFFFISDDELLSILGSSDPACVQEHMIKVSRMERMPRFSRVGVDNLAKQTSLCPTRCTTTSPP